ncbi:hypothetical protein ABI_32540 [Asticcacaulis biprosthecium C19]|uniref:Uncharacterized protein n=1 Tax=Asticcacaulis biprosthecium C19 TaxID=715226 RepID=F4QPV1_9CAUL|nr:hypothetical protein [Asticcacaulis biprosthecium]EGF90238.1 hypothetical protein ABI_32540 [Asticcacaulis biprosthecium C19]
MATQPRQFFTIWGFWIVLALYAAYLLVGPFHVLGQLSVFPRTLPADPLLWWPSLSLYSALALAMYAAVFLALIRFTRLAHSNAWMKTHTVFAAALIVCALALDLTGGTALYRDRIVTRAPSQLSPIYRSFDLGEATSIQVSCNQSANTYAVDYVVEFSGGQTVNLATGLTSAPQARVWYAAIQGLQRDLEHRGVKRFISEWHSDHSYMDCMAGYMEQLDPARRAAISELFLPAPKPLEVAHARLQERAENQTHRRQRY